MKEILKATALSLAVLAAGCANPADDKPRANVGPTRDKAATPPGDLPGTQTYVFSNDGSKVGFVGSKVTGSHNGGFNAFTGKMAVRPDKKEVAGIWTEIDMKSTWADNENLTKHLKSKDFFEVEKYPRATFVSTEIKPGGDKGASHTVTGDLSLHGVTKSIGFPATLKVDGDSASLDSEFSLNRKDFNINYPGKQDDLIRNEVVLKLTVRAKRDKDDKKP